MRKSLNLLSCFIILIFSFIFNPSMKSQMPGAEFVPGMGNVQGGLGDNQGMDDGMAMEGTMQDQTGMVASSTVTPDVAVPTAAMLTEQMPPEVPAAVVPAGPETVSFAEEKIGTQGNWIKKREWLKEAQKINVQAQQLVATIQKSRKAFTDKFSGIDNDLDTFYKQEGLVVGKVEDLFESLEKYLDKKKKKIVAALKAENEAGVTTEYQIKLDIIEDQLVADKKDLEQLKLDMKSIEDLDKSVALRLKTLDEQIKIASDQSMKAKNLFNEIWYMIDDKKARASYYELNGNIFERIKTIKSYIESDLARDFDNVLGVIRSQIAKVKEGIKGLESKGLIVRNRAERIKDLKLKELEPAPPGFSAGTTIQEIKKPKKKAWYTNLYDSVVDFVARSYVKVKKFFGLEKEEVKEFFGIKTEEETGQSTPQAVLETTSQVTASSAQQMVVPANTGMQVPAGIEAVPSPMETLPQVAPLKTGTQRIPGMEDSSEVGIPSMPSYPAAPGMEIPGGI